MKRRLFVVLAILSVCAFLSGCSESTENTDLKKNTTPSPVADTATPTSVSATPTPILATSTPVPATPTPVPATPTPGTFVPWDLTNVDISGLDPDKPTVAFTFDDGPVGTQEGSNSMRIMDVMEEHGTRCTFFYWGNKITESNKAEIERAFRLGCEVGNHTFTHPYLTSLDAEGIALEIGKTNEILSDITGLSSFLVRPPYGSTNTTVKTTVQVPLILWQVDSGDWSDSSYDSIVSKVLDQVSDGDIVLMHETYASTAEAVEYMVPYLLEHGYQVVSVSQLFKLKGEEAVSSIEYKKVK